MQHVQKVEDELRKLRYEPGYTTCLRGNLYLSLCVTPFEVLPMFLEVYKERGVWEFNVDTELDTIRYATLGPRVKLIQALHSFRVLSDAVTKRDNYQDEQSCEYSPT